MFHLLPHVRVDLPALHALAQELEVGGKWGDALPNVQTPNHRLYRMSVDEIARCLPMTLADIGIEVERFELFKVLPRKRTGTHLDLPRRTALNIAFQFEQGKSMMMWEDDQKQVIASLSTATPVLCKVDVPHWVDNQQSDIARVILSLGWHSSYDEVLARILGRQEGFEPSAS